MHGKKDDVIFVLISVLSHFRCRLGGSTRRKSLYPSSCRAALKPENVGNGVGLLHLNRFFRTFGANKKQKSPAFNNLHDWSNHTFTLFPKTIQVVDWDRLVRSFLFEAAPKVRKNRF
jgi:hypothetical protein